MRRSSKVGAGAAIDLLWRLQATDRIAGSDVPLILDELSQLSDVLPHVEKPAAATDRVLLRRLPMESTDGLRFGERPIRLPNRQR